MRVLDRLRRWRLDEDDFRDEIRAHLAIASDERIAGGDEPEAARYAALKEFGNIPLTTEAARRVWTPWWVDVVHDLAGDVRYAVRWLARNPVFSSAVIGVLALGIGLNAAVFTMLKGIALSPIAGVEGASRLAVVFRETTAGRQLPLSYPDYQYLRDHDRAFSALMGSTVATVGMGRGRDSRSLWGEFVTGNYFPVLGVRAARGRTLLPGDEAGPGREPVAVLSDGLWRRDFGADPDIVGKTITINSTPLIVVGVLEPSFHGTTVVYDVEVFIPVTMAPQLGFRFGSRETTSAGILADRTTSVFHPQGYVRPGETIETARAQADALWARLARERPLAEPAQRLRVESFWQTPNGAPLFLLPTLSVLSVTGWLVLLIACANIAGLVLVRGLARRGEIAVRLALGATRTRMLRLLMIENLLLSIPGAALGVALASRGVPVLVGYAQALAAPERVYFNVEVDALVVGFAVFVAVACALVFGFVPALQSTRLELVHVINEDAAPRGAGRGRLRTRLVVAQVAVSLLLLIAAGLVTRSLEAARRADPGFDSRHVTSMALDVRHSGYDERRGRVFYRRLLDAVQADGGTEVATLAAYEPLNLLPTPARRVEIDGYVARRGEDLAFLSNTVGPAYFRALRIPLAAGRDFDERDDQHGAPVVVVNETLARRFWDTPANALGKRLRVADGEWRTVIGVAADIKYLRIDESPRPYFYVPFLQAYRSDLFLHTRGPAPADVLLDRARAHVAALEPNLPVGSARALAGQIRGATIFFTLSATMLFVFGVAGMVLAALGTFGLVSYAVTQSTREIGIRLALGATALSVLGVFLGRGVRLGAAGALLGGAAALAGTRLLGSVLFGVSPTDPVSFAVALAAVLGAVALATLGPALRAARTDPLRALRHQ